LYVKGGAAKFVYNVLGIQEFTTEADTPLPAGRHQVRMEFAYDGGGLGKGGDVTLYVDGKAAGKGRVEGTVPMLFSADETADVGIDYASPVAQDYPGDSRFTGEINWVQLDIASDDHDHLIGPGERMKVAMARQ
jgi:arylsulfatase